MPVKRDTNHNEVTKALLQLGCSVHDLAAAGNGCPDLLVGWRGLNFLVEVKRDSKAPYTRAQILFNRMWQGQVLRAESAHDAVEKITQAYNKAARWSK